MNILNIPWSKASYWQRTASDRYPKSARNSGIKGDGNWCAIFEPATFTIERDNEDRTRAMYLPLVLGMTRNACIAAAEAMRDKILIDPAYNDWSGKRVCSGNYEVICLGTRSIYCATQEEYETAHVQYVKDDLPSGVVITCGFDFTDEADGASFDEPSSFTGNL